MQLWYLSGTNHKIRFPFSSISRILFNRFGSKFLAVVGFVALFSVPLTGMANQTNQSSGSDIGTVNFSEVDKHALAAPPEAEKSLTALARYLTANFKKDEDKARAIFRWVTDRIGYDVDSFRSNTVTNYKCRSDVVFKTRKAVCSGYVNIYCELCRQSRMQTQVINGYCKGFGYGSVPLQQRRHAWVGIRINGKWKLVDPTWSAGSVSQNYEYKKRFDALYFLTEPELFVFSHYPATKGWQLLRTPLTSKQFVKLCELDVRAVACLTPQISAKDLLYKSLNSETFHANLKKLSVFNTSNLRKVGLLDRPELSELLSRKEFGTVNAWTIKGVEDLKIHKAPLTLNLKTGQTIAVVLSAKNLTKAAIVQDKKWTYMTLENGRFSAKEEVRISSGKLHVVVHDGTKFKVCMSYMVSD